jgi:protein pelota
MWVCRVHDAVLRKRWVGVVESVEAAGGKVFIFSARHESGKQLEGLSGIAAVLRFPLPELEEEDPAALMERLHLNV